MISKKVFCDAVKAITEQLYRDRQMSKHFAAILMGSVVFERGAATEGMIKLLEAITLDRCSWLQYWLFELEQGAKYRAGSVTVDGKIVKLKTVDDLYRVLKDGFKG